jgi:uncharacterized protein (DUF305 family)
MNQAKQKIIWGKCAMTLVVLSFLSLSQVQAQMPHDMKSSMMAGMDMMQKMPATGNTDKDFAMMMKVHHEQAIKMAQMELTQGKSPEMKKMATQIIAAQKKEIAQFDDWLSQQK